MTDKIIRTLFLDIGGVLLTNGWGRQERDKAILKFNLNGIEVNERHHLTFDTFESGKLSLKEYLNRVVFYEPRDFSVEDFTKFMFGLSVPFKDTIDFFKGIKKQYNINVIAVSNEGRELNEYRINKFKLRELFDAFVSSSYVHLRKPDIDIFLMACDISQTAPEHSIYIDDRLMFVEVAQSLGMNGIQYISLEDIKEKLLRFRFGTDAGR
ncbi:MAG: HAD-IA family hydrolase [Saprospiraceae bacterium]